MTALLMEYGDFLVLIILVVYIVGGLMYVLNGLYLGEKPDTYFYKYGEEWVDPEGNTYDNNLKAISIYRNNGDSGYITGYSNATGLDKWYGAIPEEP